MDGIGRGRKFVVYIDASLKCYTMIRLKKLHTLLLIVTFAFTTTSLTAQRDVMAEIKQANDNFMELFNAGDVDAFLTVYAENGRLLPPNMGVVTGKSGARELWGGMMESGVRPELRTISVESFGKTAIEEGEVMIYLGDEMVDRAKYIVIWKRVKGEWKMYQDIWNSSMPAPSR